MPKYEWRNYFPYDEPREEQIKAIDEILNSYESGKKFVILGAGTGVGKSAIGVTVAKYIAMHVNPGKDYKPGATILTTQKLLQDQYEKDFLKSAMVSLKSASNYQCKHLPKQSCADTRPLLENEQKGTKFWNTCMLNCTYKKKKEEFINSQMGVTNFAYFLHETKYAGKIPKRQLLIIDEAHNLPDELSKFIEVSFSEKFAKSFLDLTLPEGLTPRKMVDWIQNEYYPVLLAKKLAFESNMEKYKDVLDKVKSGELSKLSKKLELLTGHESKVENFLRIWNADNWLMEEVAAEEKTGRKFQFKPIDISPYADSYVHSWGEFVLLMSATILDENGFRLLSGISEEKSTTIDIPSPFPPENHPIIYSAVGSMGNKDIDKTLPMLAAAVKEILKAHKNDKGLIHCNSYKIAWYIKKNVKSSRLLIHDSSDREDVLKKHISSSEPTVLLSPSMTEGVDLKDDLSRFQIICKVPFPYLGDKLVTKKMHKWSWWYDLQTAKTLIQAVGRSIRNDEDKAVTYILDSIWERFYHKNIKLFPENFKKSIQ
jgi:ATP-dependent DNA helicase DinG